MDLSGQTSDPKLLGMKIAVSALLLLTAIATAQEGEVIEPGSKTKWRLRVTKDGGQQVVTILKPGDLPEIVATVRPANRQSLIQQLEEVLSLSRAASIQKASAPGKTIVNGKNGLAPVTFETSDNGQTALLSKQRLNMTEIKGLRDLVSRMDSFVAQIKSSDSAETRY